MEIHPYLSELIGTAILLLLGNGVVANVNLKKTYGNGQTKLLLLLLHGDWLFLLLPILLQNLVVHI